MLSKLDSFKASLYNRRIYNRKMAKYVTSIFGSTYKQKRAKVVSQRNAKRSFPVKKMRPQRFKLYWAAKTFTVMDWCTDRVLIVYWTGPCTELELERNLYRTGLNFSWMCDTSVLSASISFVLSVPRAPCSEKGFQEWRTIPKYETSIKIWPHRCPFSSTKLQDVS